jgi:hypothetical protein
VIIELLGHQVCLETKQLGGKKNKLFSNKEISHTKGRII